MYNWVNFGYRATLLYDSNLRYIRQLVYLIEKCIYSKSTR